MTDPLPVDMVNSKKKPPVKGALRAVGMLTPHPVQVRGAQDKQMRLPVTGTKESLHRLQVHSFCLASIYLIPFHSKE